MKMLIPTLLTVLILGTVDRADAHPFQPVPNVGGVWFMNGDPSKPARIVQRQPDGNALFVNENGSQAWGTVQGRSVFIPDWNDGLQIGLQGTLRGDRIVWPNGSFWSRSPGW